ncbi:MAG: hypothetical protein HY049_08480 [Acidobacteria bacterium]|nr:hypothetical protein [Acidobacteriota bacterium]
MPRILWAPPAPGASSTLPAEIHFGSPNEFISEFAPALESGSVFLKHDKPPAVGEVRDVLVEIGFIARTFRMRAEVTEVVTLGQSRLNGKPAGFVVSFSPTSEALLAELKHLVMQLRKGLSYEAAKLKTGDAGERLPVEKQIRAMPTTLKVMLALKAGREERAALANDPDPQVLQFLLKNSKLGVDEVRAISSRTNLSHQHVTTIAGNTAWLNDEQVKLNLARNPHLPDVLVEPLLGSMSVNQLRIVSASVSTTPKARRVAHKLLFTKEK